MIRLSLSDLNKIRTVCEEANVEYFTLNQDCSSGIGSIFTLSYKSFVANYPATVCVELDSVEDW
jgi:hypothetical protein